eukprot:5393307-Amphidinium_carterae.2
MEMHGAGFGFNFTDNFRPSSVYGPRVSSNSFWKRSLFPVDKNGWSMGDFNTSTMAFVTKLLGPSLQRMDKDCSASESYAEQRMLSNRPASFHVSFPVVVCKI